MLKTLTRWWNYLVPDVDQLGDTLPKTLSEHKEHQRRVEENRLIALKALERVTKHNVTRAPLHRRTV